MQPETVAAIVGASNLLRQIDKDLAEKNFVDALAGCNSVLNHYPNHPYKIHVLNNKCVALGHLGRFVEALSCANQAIELNANDDHALYNRVIILNELGYFELALLDLDRYLQAHRNNLPLDFFYHRGLAHFHLMNLYQAERDFEQHKKRIFEYTGKFTGDHLKSIAALAELNWVNWATANVRLLLGDYQEGWKLYEARHDLDGAFRFPMPKIPVYNGTQDIKGKSLLVYAEQGFGDSIQFARYLTLLDQTGADVYVAVQTPLVDVIKTIPGNFKFLTDAKQVIKMNYRVSLMSLPAVFNTSTHNIPFSQGYVKVCDIRSSIWKQRLSHSKRFRVGICWSGGRRTGANFESVSRRRDIPPALFDQLSDIDADFFSLQLNSHDAPAVLQVQDYTKYIQHFDDTAALIDHLDLVIAVDTSTAHLAAAMGKPTWILNRFDNCWRWLMNRSDSPWYQSVQLFRQPKHHDWQSVIDQVKIQLREQVQHKIQNS